MLCKNCNTNIPDDSLFCPSCGFKVEEKKESKFCPVCGSEVKNDTNFCPNCGRDLQENTQKSIQKGEESTTTTQSKSKINKTYPISIFSTVITVFLRLIKQRTFYSLGYMLSAKKVLGLDSDLKSFFTAIPVVSAIIVLLIIVSDKKTETQQKLKTLIINGIFMALALLFIWFDFPIGF